MHIKNKAHREILIAALFLLPNFIGFLSFTFIPIIVSFILSFFRCDLLQTGNILTQPLHAGAGLTWEFIGLGNFKNLLGFYSDGSILRANDPEFWRFLWNTIFLMAKIPITVLISLGLALLLNKQIKGRIVFRTIFFLPTICVGTAFYMLWRWIFNADFGLLNLYIEKFSNGLVSGPKWLVNPNWAKPSFILMNTWAEIGGINMLLYLAALQTIPQDYYEAGSLDGAGAWQKFRYITWPLLGPTTFFILIINLINGFQEGFQQAHIMTQGGPAGSTTVLSYYIYNHAYVWNHMGYASAISWVLFIIIIIITAISWKLGNRVVFYK